jgi:hypothetical protein
MSAPGFYNSARWILFPHAMVLPSNPAAQISTSQLSFAACHGVTLGSCVVKLLILALQIIVEARLPEYRIEPTGVINFTKQANSNCELANRAG